MSPDASPPHEGSHAPGRLTRSLVLAFALAWLTLGTWLASLEYRVERSRHRLDGRLAQGFIDRSIADLEALRIARAGSAALTRDLGRSYRLRGLYRQSEEDRRVGTALLATASRLNPLDAETHMELGWALLQDGELRSAEASMAAAAERDPYNVTYLYSLGRLRETQGRVQDAIDLYRQAQAIKRDPIVAVRLRLLLPPSP